MLSFSSSGISFAKSNRGIQNEGLFSAINAQPSIALARTLSMDVTAIIMPNSTCAVTMRSKVLKDYTKKCLGLPDHAIRVEAFAGTTAGTDLPRG